MSSLKNRNGPYFFLTLDDELLVFDPPLLRAADERVRDVLFEGLRLMVDRRDVPRDETPEDLFKGCRVLELLMYRLLLPLDM